MAASGELHARDKAADTGGAPLPSVPANDTRTGTMVDPQTVADRRLAHCPEWLIAPPTMSALTWPTLYRAQHLLVTGLRAAFPELKIVAEEEGARWACTVLYRDGSTYNLLLFASGALLAPDDPVVEMKVDKQHPWIDAQKFPPELLAVPVEDVCVWVRGLCLGWTPFPA